MSASRRLWCFMYLNFSQLTELTRKTENDAAVLTQLKERFDAQIIRLCENTQTEAIAAEMKRTSEQLAKEIHTLKAVTAILQRAAEEYDHGETKITDYLEDGESNPKSGFVSYRRFRNIDFFIRLLK